MKFSMVTVIVMFLSSVASADSGFLVGDGASELVQALSDCQKEFAETMKDAAWLEPIGSTAVTETDENGNTKKVTQTFEVTSMSNGSPLGDPSERVATLAMEGVVFDSSLPCDSVTCTTYQCKVKKY